MAANYASQIPPQTATGAETDASALDNRMALDPNDPRWADTVGEWEDGQEYNVKATIRQVSPGEFEVTSLSEVGGKEASPATDETETEGGPNPAVKSMMEDM